jgi:phage baseplate assembly protein gpV
MDRRERSGRLLDGILAAQAGLQATIWTALPCTVVSYDATKKTCVLQPTLQASIQDESGEFHWETLPLLLDCPVFFPQGGGCVLTFPIQPGDEALVIFASRCIDSWWQSGGIQVQAELRMHSLSDGFAFVGISSMPAVPAAMSTTTAQLRTLDGSTYVEVNPAGSVNVVAAGNISASAAGNITAVAGGSISANAATAINLTAPNIAMTGNISMAAGGVATLTGTVNIVGTLTVNGLNFSTHRHSGVVTGANNSGGPVP